MVIGRDALFPAFSATKRFVLPCARATVTVAMTSSTVNNGAAAIMSVRKTRRIKRSKEIQFTKIEKRVEKTKNSSAKEREMGRKSSRAYEQRLKCGERRGEEERRETKRESGTKKRKGAVCCRMRACIRLQRHQ